MAGAQRSIALGRAGGAVAARWAAMAFHAAYGTVWPGHRRRSRLPRRDASTPRDPSRHDSVRSLRYRAGQRQFPPPPTKAEEGSDLHVDPSNTQRVFSGLDPPGPPTKITRPISGSVSRRAPLYAV